TNTVEGTDPTIGGGFGNRALADFATIAGGGTSSYPVVSTGNRVTDQYGTVGGGGNNQAGDSIDPNDPKNDAPYATVAGGLQNTAGAGYTFVGGGYLNAVTGSFATIGGGASNTATGLEATVSGGYGNTAAAVASVGGGQTN